MPSGYDVIDLLPLIFILSTVGLVSLLARDYLRRKGRPRI